MIHTRNSSFIMTDGRGKRKASYRETVQKDITNDLAKENSCLS